jgi:hypothetical protein
VGLQVTLADILTAARLKSDNVRLTDAQLLPVVNKGHTALHNLLADAIADFKLSSKTFSTTANTGTYDVTASPISVADFFLFRGLEIQVGSGADDWADVNPYQWKQRNSFRNAQLYTPGSTNRIYQYRYQDKNIVLKPTPVAVDAFKVWYTPTAYQFTSTADATAIDGIDGYDDFISNYVAIFCLINEDRDTSALLRQQAEIKETIQKLKASRDAGAPRIVAAAADLQDLWEW